MLFIVCLLFIGCNTATNTPEKETTDNQNNTETTTTTTTTTTEPEEKLYPSLKIENNITGSNEVLGVSLVNYDFSPLGISGGKSQTFILDKGMPGGYEHILVVINFGVPGGSVSPYRTYRDFEDGQTTIIKVNPKSGGGIEIK